MKDFAIRRVVRVFCWRNIPFTLMDPSQWSPSQMYREERSQSDQLIYVESLTMRVIASSLVVVFFTLIAISQ